MILDLLRLTSVILSFIHLIHTYLRSKHLTVVLSSSSTMGISRRGFCIFDFGPGRILSRILDRVLFKKAAAAGFSPSDSVNIDGLDIRAIETLFVMFVEP